MLTIQLPDQMPPAYRDLFARLVATINGVDADIAVSSLLSLYRTILLSQPQFHGAAKKHLADLLSDLNGREAKQAPAATSAPAGAPANSFSGGYAIAMTAEMSEAVGKLLPFIAEQGWEHSLLLSSLIFIFHETALANRCCLQASADCLASVSAALYAQAAAKSLSAAEQAGQPLH